MKISIISHNGHTIARIDHLDHVIQNTQDTLDLLAEVHYNHQSSKIIIPKELLCGDFFDLRTGLAGEILQKFTTYQTQIAITGDFSGYTSKALKDFIYESNQGNQVFFLPGDAEAIQMLAK